MVMFSSADILVTVILNDTVHYREGGSTNSSQYEIVLTNSSDLVCCSVESDQPQLNFYLNGLSMLIVIALGIIGNTMAMMVLTRRTMRTSTNVFLTALAIWDTIVLLVCLLLISLIELLEPFKEHVFAYIVVYAYPIGLAAQTATVWLTMSFTVERYIAVCHPLRAASMCTIPRARTVVLVISVVSIFYNIPRWFEYTIVTSIDECNKICIYPNKTALANDSIYHKIYFGWLYFLVMCFIPLCSLAILNAFLIVAVRRSKQQRKDMNVRQSRENNVTIMLASVVMVFIICQVPALIYNMAYSIDMIKVSSSSGWNVLSNIRNFLVTLNSAVNFILYCALGQKFRRTFVRTLCPCLLIKLPERFQSFSFNDHHRDSVHHKNVQGGNKYAKVNYTKCGTDKQLDKVVGIDMKVLRPKHSPAEYSDSNGSGDPVDVYNSNHSHRSHMTLLTPVYKGKTS